MPDKKNTVAKPVFTNVDHMSWESKDGNYTINGRNSSYLKVEDRQAGYDLVINSQTANVKDKVGGWFPTLTQAKQRAIELAAKGIVYETAKGKAYPLLDDTTYYAETPHPLPGKKKSEPRQA